MLSRRTRALIGFLGGLYRVARLLARGRGERGAEQRRFVPRYVALGVTFQILREWTHDRDLGRIRTSNLRRIALSATLLALALTAMRSMAESERESLTLGGAVGTVLYRLRYGVLRPLPEKTGG